MYITGQGLFAYCIGMFESEEENPALERTLYCLVRKPSISKYNLKVKNKIYIQREQCTDQRDNLASEVAGQWTRKSGIKENTALVKKTIYLKQEQYSILFKKTIYPQS